jgi:hypothetical protein
LSGVETPDTTAVPPNTIISFVPASKTALCPLRPKGSEPEGSSWTIQFGDVAPREAAVAKV